MPGNTADIAETSTISGVKIPDSTLAREATELVRDTESPLLFNHSTRVYYFGSLAGKQQYSSKSDRFEVDGANTARAFLREPQPAQILRLSSSNYIDDFAEGDREAVVRPYPRTEHFKEDIIQAFYDGNEA